MTQAFSLYGELTVAQNLQLHAELYHLPKEKIGPRIEELLERYDLKSVVNARPDSLPLGIKQRLQLAVAVLHEPVHSHPRRADVGRRPDRARRLLANADRSLARRRRDDFRHHPFHERGRSLRPHLAHARRQGACGRRAAGAGQGARQRFARGLLRRLSRRSGGHRHVEKGRGAGAGAPSKSRRASGRSASRLAGSGPTRGARRSSCLRDPIRLAFALVGPIILMLAFGYGISFDIENLATAAFDQDDTPAEPRTAPGLRGVALFLGAAADHVGGARRSGGSRAATPRSSSRCRPDSAATFSTTASRKSTRRSTAP